MLRIISMSFIIFIIIILTGCNGDQNQSSNEEVLEHSGTSVTQYTDSTEIFMEYPALLTDSENNFLIHLTDLKDFKAVTQGTITIELKKENGTKFTLIEKEPVRPGIYIPVVKFSEPGNYIMVINLNGKQVSDKIIVKDIIVYSAESELPNEDEEVSSTISFLKEQQWKIDFANELVVTRQMQKSVVTTGKIKAKPELFSKVISPVSGIVLHKNNATLKTIGTFIKKGAILLNISPTADAETNVQKINSDYLLAKSEYERVQSLFDKKAVSQKRLEQSKFDFETKQLIFNSLTDQVKITESGYAIVAPISGYIQIINFSLGTQIESGQELFSIINPSRLILQANVPSSQSDVANNSSDATFIVEGMNSEFRISSLNGKKLSVAASLNEMNRTIPVYFEFDNPNNRIKVGMYAETFIKVGEAAPHISIPESAIINEDGLHTAYVQIEGEAFEKRILKTGITDNGYVQVISGLKVGERIVTVGAYQVRLAELSPESAIGHGHVH